MKFHEQKLELLSLQVVYFLFPLILPHLSQTLILRFENEWQIVFSIVLIFKGKESVYN